MITTAIIPARGGSKGIPRKNVKLLGGKPLIAWTIEAALGAPSIHNVVVSTEDEEIANIAVDLGAQVPFMRPAELALDETPGIAPIKHACERIPKTEAIVVLQPTSPFRTSSDIEAIISLAAMKQAKSAVSVCKTAKHPFWSYCFDGDRLVPVFQGKDLTQARQTLPQTFGLNGALYYAEANWFRNTGVLIDSHTIGYVMPAERSIDLDSKLDWAWAEFLLEKGLHA